jgi:hypothetical protein
VQVGVVGLDQRHAQPTGGQHAEQPDRARRVHVDHVRPVAGDGVEGGGGGGPAQQPRRDPQVRGPDRQRAQRVQPRLGRLVRVPRHDHEWRMAGRVLFLPQRPQRRDDTVAARQVRVAEVHNPHGRTVAGRVSPNGDRHATGA